MKLTCKFCNNEFEWTNGKSKEFCCKNCKNEYSKLEIIEIHKCEFCGQDYKYTKNQLNWNKTGIGNTDGSVSSKRFCSYNCGIKYRRNKIKKTCLERYGVESNLQSTDTKEKSKQTCLEKYGVDNVFKSTEIKEKIKKTCLDKYGVDSYSKTDECKSRRKEYFNNNYNVDSFGQINREKTKQTNLEKYGNTWGNKEKSKQTCIEKYGVDNYSKTENFRNKMKENRNIIVEKTFNTKKTNGTLYTSKIEKEVNDYIISLGFKTTKYITGKNENRFEIDIFISEKNIGIEFNGSYFHSINGKKKGFLSTKYHYNKSLIAQEQGIELIHIWEDQWLHHQELVKTIIKARLGVLDSTNRIYARQCKIQEIDNKTYKDFVIKNHIQGYKSASVRLGLFYNNQLVQIASFNKVRNMGKASSQNDKYEYEWVRGCPASNNVVIGGTSKLFKHFIKIYNPQSVLCYADWNLFNGKGYKECGFEFVGYTGPDKFYIRPSDSKRINRNPYKYKEFKELVRQGKLLECYGVGSLKFIFKNY